MLGMIFQVNGGIDNVEKFLISYFNYYQYKERETSEFTRALTIKPVKSTMYISCIKNAKDNWD